MNECASRLKEERMRLGMTQDAFAEVASVSKRAVANYESGSRKPDSDFLTSIAAAGADVLYILTGQRNPNLDDPRPAPPKYVPPPPDEEWLLDAYRFSSTEGKKIIMGATKAAALAARGAMPEPPRRKAR